MPWPSSELFNVEADVYVWRCALLVVHARKEEEYVTLQCHRCNIVDLDIHPNDDWAELIRSRCSQSCLVLKSVAFSFTVKF